MVKQKIFINKTFYSYINGILKMIFPWHRISYSQRGEDLIVQDIFNISGIAKPSYLDIGANDPIILNNTYLFYKSGCRGVCIEPNPELYKLVHKKRQYDISLNIGITGKKAGMAKFSLFDNKDLSTFSEKQTEFLIKNTKYRVTGEIPIF